ncbi:MAG: MarR family transcriptional regulator [Oscillospiraceae bacterium]|nr:MarR family transcriptional regulator [Oscillospiraceae bacterium]
MVKRNTSLLEEFSQVQKLLSKYQLWYCRKFGPSGDPHRGQGRVLSILNLQPEITQKELSYLLDMRNQSLGELLGKLEKSGAIIREPSQDDRRGMSIKLTAAGAELIKQGGKKPNDVSSIFDCLCADDQAKLHEILDCLSTELEKLLGHGEEAEKEKRESDIGRHKKAESEPKIQKPASDSERHEIMSHHETHREKQ